MNRTAIGYFLNRHEQAIYELERLDEAEARDPIYRYDVKRRVWEDEALMMRMVLATLKEKPLGNVERLRVPAPYTRPTPPPGEPKP